MNDEPVIRVVRGEASPEDVAAILGALIAIRPRAENRTPPKVWGAPASRLRRPLQPGPGAWRASGLPISYDGK